MARSDANTEFPYTLLWLLNLRFKIGRDAAKMGGVERHQKIIFGFAGDSGDKGVINRPAADVSRRQIGKNSDDFRFGERGNFKERQISHNSLSCHSGRKAIRQRRPRQRRINFRQRVRRQYT